MSKFVKLLSIAVLASFGSINALPAGDNVVDTIKETVGDSKKPFALGFVFQVKAGETDKFEATLAKTIKLARKEKGCMAFDLNRDPKDGQRYVLYERWQNLDAFIDHTNTEHVKTAVAEFGDLLDGAPEVKILWVVGE